MLTTYVSCVSRSYHAYHVRFMRITYVSCVLCMYLSHLHRAFPSHQAVEVARVGIRDLLGHILARRSLSLTLTLVILLRPIITRRIPSVTTLAPSLTVLLLPTLSLSLLLILIAQKRRLAGASTAAARSWRTDSYGPRWLRRLYLPSASIPWPLAWSRAVLSTWRGHRLTHAS